MQLCQEPVGQSVRVSDELFEVLQKASVWPSFPMVRLM